jgi:hypothetical protein
MDFLFLTVVGEECKKTLLLDILKKKVNTAD